MTLESIIGIIGSTAIGLGSLIFTAWCFRRDEAFGAVAMLFSVMVILCAFVIIAELST